MRRVIFGLVITAIYLSSLTSAVATPVSSSDTLPKISVTPIELNFGQVAVGLTKQLSLLISNTSDTALRLSVVADSVRPAPFTIDSGGGKFTLDSGKMRRLYVTIKPFQVGTAIDSIVINSNTDSAHKHLVVYLVGSGFIPDTIARISVTPTTIDFGTTYTGQTYQRTFSIRNTTNTNIKLGGTVLGTHLPFSVPTGLGNFLIDSGAYNTVTVRFMPADTGSYRDSVIVMSSTDNSTKRIVVYLKGLVKPSDLLKPQINIRSFTLDFGKMQVNPSADPTLTFSIKNVSDSERTLTVNLLFPHNPFSVSGTSDHLQLARFESQYVTAHFAATTIGQYVDSIIVISDAPQSRIPVYLKAEVLGPDAVKASTENASAASIYPNPATRSLSVELTVSSSAPVSCSLYDENGRCVLTSRQMMVEGPNTIRFDVSLLDAGRYECRIEGERMQSVSSFVISR